ncbi:hypothetical protein C0Q70_08855 [Pomacea canaliculata]|uniref:Uncharacterized protein n=1 Tax=Pomacea canaliculata TaxID=400727 RepID=A0A2T7P852_POMCA|nr:hypothetical protein C0Q70_08855 [Pomacea canaliculata]
MYLFKADTSDSLEPRKGKLSHRENHPRGQYPVPACPPAHLLSSAAELLTSSSTRFFTDDVHSGLSAKQPSLNEALPFGCKKVRRGRTFVLVTRMDLDLVLAVAALLELRHPPRASSRETDSLSVLCPGVLLTFWLAGSSQELPEGLVASALWQTQGLVAGALVKKAFGGSS